MVQEIEMTKEEQMIMYMKCSKKELCEMLIEANRHLKNLPIHVVSQRSELLPDFLYKDDFGIKIGYHGDAEVSEEWNAFLEKLGNCG